MEDYPQIHSVIAEQATFCPDRVALQMHSEGRLTDQYTYGQLVNCFQLGSKQLQAWGMQPGDRVVLLAENSPAWVEAYLSALASELTVVLLDPTLTPEELVLLIQRSDARASLISSKLYTKLELDLKPEILILNIHNRLTPFEGSAPHRSTLPPTADPDRAIASILFTSGTTGQPRGVLLSHSNLIQNTRAIVDRTELPARGEYHQLLAVLPLNHLGGLICACLAPLMRGATITFLESVRGDTILAAMQTTHTTVLPAVPRLFELFHQEIYQQVAAKGRLAAIAFSVFGRLNEIIRAYSPWNPGRFFFRPVHNVFGGSLQLSCCGAAPLSVTIERGLERIGFTLVKAYGLTETGMVSANPPQQPRLGHVGSPLQGADLCISQPHPSSGEGEICVRGEALMPGYFRDPEATAEAIRDGWFHTGDLGRIDANGNLHITGRIKELIVTPGGKKASPTAIEAYYQNLPGVQELAVVGIPRMNGGGDEIHCAVVMNQAIAGSFSPSEQQQQLERLISDRAAEVPPFLRIQKVHRVDQLPKTSTLKVKRTVLRQQFTDAGAGVKNTEITLELDDISRRAIAIARVVSGSPHVKASSTLQFDLGLDSLGLVDLAAKLEAAFGIRLNEQDLPTCHTVDNLIVAVRAALPMANRPSSADGTGEPLAERIAPIPQPRNLVDRLALSIFAVLLQFFWRLEVSGVENLPSTQAFILCPNHESHLDIFWVAAGLPKNVRDRLCCFAKQEHFQHPLTRIITRLTGAIPTDRNGDILPTLRAGVKVLIGNRPLLIHPEGTRTRTGELLPFRRGAAKLAIETQALLVPVRLVGSYAIFPPHQRLPKIWNWQQKRRYTLKVIFGAPIIPRVTDNDTTDNDTTDNDTTDNDTPEADLTAQLRAAVASLGKTIEAPQENQKHGIDRRLF
jgi:long-chain acyl-CoA synthetase